MIIITIVFFFLYIKKWRATPPRKRDWVAVVDGDWIMGGWHVSCDESALRKVRSIHIFLGERKLPFYTKPKQKKRSYI